MPWKATDVVDERTRFVLEYDSGSFTMSELSRIYGISRKTGYEWADRYEREGLSGLADRRYGAGTHPNQTSARIAGQIIALKHAHPSWGAKKLRGYLMWNRGSIRWASLEYVWRDIAS